MLGVWRLAEAHKLKMQEDATGPVVGYVNKTTLTGLWKVQSREGERLQFSVQHKASHFKKKRNTPLDSFCIQMRSERN